MPRRRRLPCFPQIAERYFGKNQDGGGGTAGGGSEKKRNGEIAAVKAFQEEVTRGSGGSSNKKEEKAFNKMAEKLMKLSKEMENLKEWAPENFAWDELDAGEVDTPKSKKGKSKDKKSAAGSERESARGDHKDAKPAAWKESKADKKEKGKPKDGRPKEKKSETTWREGNSAEVSNIEKKRAKSQEHKVAKKAKTEGNGYSDDLVQDFLLPDDIKKAKKVKKDKKDKDKDKGKKSKSKSKKIKNVEPKEGKQKQAKGSQKSVPVPAGVYGGR